MDSSTPTSNPTNPTPSDTSPFASAPPAAPTPPSPPSSFVTEELPSSPPAPAAPTPKNRRKIIFSLATIFILIGGLAIGIVLIQQQQFFRQKASTGSECTHAPDCTLFDNAANQGSNSVAGNISRVVITNQNEYPYSSSTNDGCYDVTIDGKNFSWNKIGPGPNCKDVSNVQVWFTATTLPTPTSTSAPTPTSASTPTSSPTASPTIQPTPTTPGSLLECSCHTIKVYDSSWTQLDPTQILALGAEDIIFLTVSGSSSTGSIQEARFIINNTQQPAVTTKRPSTDEFYYQYTIPEGVTQISISAQLYHPEVGWF